MWTHPVIRKGLNRSNLVAAIFQKTVWARDAITDLKLAGFTSGDIGVALSKGSRREERNQEAIQSPGSLEGKHSVSWKLRHSVRRDIQSHGPGLSSHEDVAAASEEQPPYTEIDLTETLRELGVAEDTVQFLDRDVGPHGIFVLVNSGDRGRETESILERNGGHLRSVMVTERTPVIH
jgi:hypothetical protein